jgi:uncharacterized protein (DUF1330 family)
MSAYVIANYTITNPQGYEAYVPAAGPTLAAHGGEVLVADYQSEAKEGTPGHVTVVLRFESKDAARAWYESAAYQAAKPHRVDNTQGSVVICDGFTMPA